MIYTLEYIDGLIRAYSEIAHDRDDPEVGCVLMDLELALPKLSGMREMVVRYHGIWGKPFRESLDFNRETARRIYWEGIEELKGHMNAL